MAEDYSEKLCDEKHKNLGEQLVEIKDRLKSIEGYGKAILTALVVGIVMQYTNSPKASAMPTNINAYAATTK